METIITFFQNLINNYTTPENCKLLRKSLETQITTIKNEISELESDLSKTTNTINLYETNQTNSEQKYAESKQKLEKYNTIVEDKLNNFKLKLIKIFDKSEEPLYKCKEIDTLYNNFKCNEDISILENYEILQKDIENNIIQCEIAKEKLEPIKNKYDTLMQTKNDKINQLSKLNDLKDSLQESSIK